MKNQVKLVNIPPFASITDSKSIQTQELAGKMSTVIVVI